VTTHPAWLLDERASIGRENLDPGHVARYDDKEDADGAAEVARLAALGFGAGTVALDLGAGTGQFALAAAAADWAVTAVDPSPVMLARLRAKASGSNLAVAEGGFLTYDHAGPPVDVVYSRYALHHVPDFWKAVALRRIHGMLRPGGLFRLWDVVFHFGVDEVAGRIEQWCATVPAEPGSAGGGEWTRADLEEHVRDEHSTFTWLLEPMVDRAGFSIEGAEYTDGGFGARYLLRA
jgi:SAM-dependent methyltransferase